MSDSPRISEAFSQFDTSTKSKELIMRAMHVRIYQSLSNLMMILSEERAL